MATIQQSIEIKVPVHIAYNQLTQFEDYPQFMQEVEAVQQIDDTHLHWTTMMSNHPVEWDAEITEQHPDNCIAWHNTSGPHNAGKVEVQAVGADASRVIFTLESEPQQSSDSSAGKNSEDDMVQRLRLDLARLKDLIEARGSETGAWQGEVRDAKVTTRTADQGADRSGGTTLAPASGYAAGSEGWSGDEDPTSPVVSSPAQAASSYAPGSDGSQANQATQSDYSLSKSADDDSAEDGRYSIAEEVNFDQQSDTVRHVGQMPQDTSAELNGGISAPDAMGEAMQRDTQDAKDDAKLKSSISRAVPPSE